MSELARTDKGFAFRPGTADEWVLREASSAYRLLIKRMASGDRVLDAGGYIGTFAAKAAKRGADVLSYEPCEDNFRVLAVNAATFGFRAVRAALLPHSQGSATFWAPTGGVQMPYGSLLRKGRNYAQVHVAAASIKEVQREFLPRWVKVDVEGVECELVRALDWSSVDGLAVEYELRQEEQRGAAELLDDDLRSSGFVCEARRVKDHSAKLWSTMKTYIREGALS